MSLTSYLSSVKISNSAQIINKQNENTNINQAIQKLNAQIINYNNQMVSNEQKINQLTNDNLTIDTIIEIVNK